MNSGHEVLTVEITNGSFSQGVITTVITGLAPVISGLKRQMAVIAGRVITDADSGIARLVRLPAATAAMTKVAQLCAISCKFDAEWQAAYHQAKAAIDDYGIDSSAQRTALSAAAAFANAGRILALATTNLDSRDAAEASRMIGLAVLELELALQEATTAIRLAAASAPPS